MKDYNSVKINIIGYTGSGKSTYAALIGKTLGEFDIPYEIIDGDRKEGGGEGKEFIKVKSTMLKRLESLSKSLKKTDGKLIIETIQVARTQKVI